MFSQRNIKQLLFYFLWFSALSIGIWRFAGLPQASDWGWDLSLPVTLYSILKPFSTVEFMTYQALSIIVISFVAVRLRHSQKLLSKNLFQCYLALFALFLIVLTARATYVIATSQTGFDSISLGPLTTYFIVFFIPEVLFFTTLMVVLFYVIKKWWLAFIILILYYSISGIIFELNIDPSLFFYGRLPYSKAPYEYFSGFSNYYWPHFLYVGYWLLISCCVYLVHKMFFKKNKTPQNNKRLFFALLAAICLSAYIGFNIYQITIFSYHYKNDIDIFRTPKKELVEKDIDLNRFKMASTSLKVALSNKNKSLRLRGVYKFSTGDAEITKHIAILLPIYTQPSTNEAYKVKVAEEIVCSTTINKGNASLITLCDPVLSNTPVEVSFDVIYHSKIGFFAPNYNNKITEDYTYLESQEILPAIGLISDKPEGSDKQLTVVDIGKQLKKKIYDYFFSRFCDRTDVFITSEKGQIAISAGEQLSSFLNKKTVSYHYQINTPQKLGFPIISAKYETENIISKHYKINIYYLDKFKNNVELIKGASKSILEYYRRTLGATNTQTVNIVQRPIDSGLSRTFPNLVTLSTKYAFDLNPEQADNGRQLIHLLSHELAHLWFGYTLHKSNSPGGLVLSEGLSQYLSMLAIENLRNKSHREYVYQMQKAIFNRYKAYNKPLIATTNDARERFLTYAKSAIVFQNIANCLGESQFLRSLKQYLTSIDRAKDYSLINLVDYLFYNSESKCKRLIIKSFYHS